MIEQLDLKDYTDEDFVNTSIIMAVMAHEGQKDKSGKPYIFHPMTVALNFPDDPNAFVVAMLHDTFEDCKEEMIIEMIRSAFKPHIIEAVEAISKKEGETNVDYWKRCRKNPLALKVKLKDIEHNSSPERLSYLPEEQRVYLVKKYEKAKNILNESD